jgi:hypothetical protein
MPTPTSEPISDKDRCYGFMFILFGFAAYVAISVYEPRLEPASCELGSGNSDGGIYTKSCEECVPGKFSDTTGAEACMNCAAGYWSAVIGSESADDCVPCEAGKASATLNATSAATCTVCEAGKASATGAAACGDCPSETYANGGVCVECAAGSYGTALGYMSASDCQQVS